MSLTCDIQTHQSEFAASLFDIDEKEISSSIQRFTVLRIRQRLEETLDIPPMPETARAIIRLRTDPDADANKLARIVETDPSLAAQVVSWASASYYSAPGSVKSVQDAIVRVLGYDLVMNLSLGLSLGKSLQLPKAAPQGGTPYWQQAVFVAAMATGLVNTIPAEYRPSHGLAYLSGLLHNFGYLILAHSFKPHFHNLVSMIEVNPHIEPCVIERHLLGIDREQIAANLLKAWGLPNEVCVAVRYLQHPEYPGIHSDFSKLVFVATQTLRQAGIVSGVSRPIDDQIWKDLQLTRHNAAEVLQHLSNSMMELEDLANTLANAGQAS